MISSSNNNNSNNNNNNNSNYPTFKYLYENIVSNYQKINDLIKQQQQFKLSNFLKTEWQLQKKSCITYQLWKNFQISKNLLTKLKEKIKFTWQLLDIVLT